MAGTMCLGSVYTSSAEGEGQDAGPLEEKRVAPTPRFSWGGVPLSFSPLRYLFRIFHNGS